MEALQWVTLALTLIKLASIAIPAHLPEREQKIDASGNTVNVGMDATKPDPQRDWFTVAEVAERERLSVRTITDYIKLGRISADRDGARAYRIPKDYQISPPLTAANGGN